MDTLLTPRQAAERLAVSLTTVYRLATANHPAAIRVGHQWRFDPSRLTEPQGETPSERTD
ncbi:MAG: helix-turn-helix domain-containing protein [Planctomycetota bacterium]